MKGSRVTVCVPEPEPKRCSERVIDTVWDDIHVQVTPPADYPITDGFADRVREGVERWLAGLTTLVIPKGFKVELYHVNE